MKNITDYILEALNTLPKEFMNIWKGKPANIDPEYFDNISLLSQGIVDVHRKELPTEKEFDNLCNWIIDNFKSKSKSDIELFFTKFIDVFIDTNTIKPNWKWDDTFKGGGYVATQYIHSVDKGEPSFFFFYHEFKERYKEVYKDRDIEDLPIIKKMFNKWNRNDSNWPDYSKSFQKLSDYVNHL